MRYLTILLLLVAAASKAQCPDSVSCGSTITLYYSSKPNGLIKQLDLTTASTRDTVDVIVLQNATLPYYLEVAKGSLACTDIVTDIDYLKANLSTTWVSCNTSTPLPVSLIYFGAGIDRNVVTIEWQTASEVNSSHFLIQRYDGDWLDLDTVRTSGNSNEIKTYNYIDVVDCNGRYYYRLVHFDFDGSSQEEGVVPVDITWFKREEVMYDLLGRKL